MFYSSLMHKPRHQETVEPPSSPLECRQPGCYKKFTGDHAKRNRSRHEKDKHTDHLPYMCTDCGKVFQRTDALTKHKRKCPARTPTTSNELLVTEEADSAHITSASPVESQAAHQASYSSEQEPRYTARAASRGGPQRLGTVSYTTQQRSSATPQSIQQPLSTASYIRQPQSNDHQEYDRRGRREETRRGDGSERRDTNFS
jgi:hypothetical protein